VLSFPRSSTCESGIDLGPVESRATCIASIISTYDAANRVTSTAYTLSGVTDQTIVFGYDAGAYGKGRLTSASDANHSLSWTYDALGRVVQKTQTVANVTSSVGYTYVNGDLVTLTTPSGQIISYGYANHQINSITVNGTPLLSNVSYEPFGPSRGWTWGNGSNEIRLYDTDGNPSQFTGAESTTYAIDSAFRIVGITNNSTPSVSWTYGYDLFDRVTSANTSSAALTWTYDADGNLQSQSGSSALDATATLGYNNRGRVISALAGSGQMTAIYNALGQRILKASPLATIVFAYDEAGHLLGEYTASGALIEETVWMGDLPVATVQPNGAGGINVFYIDADHLGTPKAITQPSGNSIVWRWDQDPFGTAAPNQNPNALGAFPYNPRFPGQYYDQETGLLYNYFRDYDPTVGRYVESDPIGLMAGINTYTCASGNPISNVDSLGLLDNPAEVINYYPPPPPYQVVPGIPQGSVWYQAPNGQCFVAPPGVNWQAMQVIGWAAGPTAPLLVIQGSMLDLQRSNGNVYPAYQYAANYGVGVVMQGAGYPQWAMNFVGTEYGAANSINAGNNNWTQWWANGWNAAQLRVVCDRLLRL
jgi:RHS repeat-associated protein